MALALNNLQRADMPLNKETTNHKTTTLTVKSPKCELIYITKKHRKIVESSIIFPIYQPLRSGRIWHMVNF